MTWRNYDPALRLRRGGPEGWIAAVRRAGLIATYSRSYGQGIDEHQAVALLALLLYSMGSGAGGADAVDLDAVRELIDDASDRRHGQAHLARLHDQLAAGLRQAGHDLDAWRARRADVDSVNSDKVNSDEIDPVVAAWVPLDLEPVDTDSSLSEFPAWMVHPRGSTPLGRAGSTVRDWLEEQDRPHTEPGGLRDFGETAWDPPGPRLHIHVPVTDEVRALAEVYAPVVHAWRHVLRPVDPQFLHLTLAWHQLLAGEISDDQREQLHDAAAAALAGAEPCTLTVGRAVVTPHGVGLDVSPDRLVWQLVAAMCRAFDTVFGGPSGVGAGTYPRPDWRPHITLAYAHASGPASGLAYDLTRFRDHRTGEVVGGHRPTPVELPVSGLLLVDQDTYAPDGLTWSNERLVEPVAVS